MRTRYGEFSVIEKLGGGTQGDVYSVLYNGERKALKWYHPDVFLDRDAFVKNLQRNIDRRAPTDEFLWPIDRTDVDACGQLGYIMNLKPAGFYVASDLFRNPGLFPSFKRVVDACLNIAHAFMILHSAGYVYRDISGDNFFINPQTGKVLICDNDNVAPPNADTGIRGTPRFMAPEIVVTNENPTASSDLHSLAVMIFYLLLLQHPLEGRKAGVMDAETKVKLYGTEPLFIFDEDDTTNALNPEKENNALDLWSALPAHMKNIFHRAFSRQALREGRRRPSEIEWLRELARLRSEIVPCRHCGNEVYMDNVAPAKCDNTSCGALIESPLRAYLPLFGYALPAIDDMRIYRCQTVLVCNPTNAIDPLAWMLPSDGQQRLSVLNIAEKPWCVNIDGKKLLVPPNQAVRVCLDMKLCIGQEEIEITLSTS